MAHRLVPVPRTPHPQTPVPPRLPLLSPVPYLPVPTPRTASALNPPPAPLHPPLLISWDVWNPFLEGVMSVNSSSASLLSNSSSILYEFLQKCYDTTAGTFSSTTFTVTSLLIILPLCVYVIYLGFQRWRQQRSGTTMSHSDVFTFHMVVVELVSIVGSIIICCGILTRFSEMLMAGMCLLTINISGQQFFHTLTCVERYLAVVHPVTYLGLKRGKGIRLRNISIGCVWLLIFVNLSVYFVEDKRVISIFSYCTTAFIFMVICFCSLSVLYVLIRPGPRAGGEGRPRVDQSKMRAFYTIMAILGVLSIRVGATAVIAVLFTSPHLGESDSRGGVSTFPQVPVMSVNSSSSSSLRSNSSSMKIHDLIQKCYDTTAGIFSLTALTITSLLLILPLCVYVIYLGFQRWRQQRSGTTMSHSDVFTFHMVAVELMNIVGTITLCCGVATRLPVVMMVGVYLLGINVFGQQFFHTLTCVERYLAVVHPVTYLGLKKGKGIRLRNISFGCVWLLVFADMYVLSLGEDNVVRIFSYCITAFNFMVISLCSLSVLYVLIRPGPGAGGEGRPRVDQSKMRAFYTIMIILGALFLRSLGTALTFAVYTSPHLEGSEQCSVFLSVSWFTLPSSLVLPLLFIHRAGKLLCCKNSNQPGQGPE
ncbi:hypothetical protein EYF80_051682 [Liparis tanakae]|uniref:G-protein coupled receptors family 1 profile domain-containing protein n=1 Tax=Liparis tanakae TaxID=230148 RepID=A0A4Z2FBG4_9TELE|nr:hypothetical protein EYF80_051682 [Liparis tanakae]